MGGNLIQALLAPPSEKLVITPPLGFTSSGPGGGPFTVTSQTYTLTNIGTTSLNWSVISTSLWLTVSANPGALKPSASATITIGLNAAATNVLIGNESGNVSIENLSDGTAQNREFDLYAGNGGFETGDFTDWIYVGDTNLSFALAGDDADIGGTNALPGVSDGLFVHAGLYGAYLGEWDNGGDSPTNGSLSQTVSTQPGQAYQVSFWLTSIASAGATTPNYFVAKWNGSALYAQTNVGAFGWTNMQFIVPASARSATLQFDFNDIPGAFGLDDVAVSSLPAPVLQPVARVGNNITLTWNTVSNLTYQLQAIGNLHSATWTNVLPAITATGASLSESEPISKTTNQFYRVILLPPP
jgi:hypothetical protein